MALIHQSVGIVASTLAAHKGFLSVDTLYRLNPPSVCSGRFPDKRGYTKYYNSNAIKSQSRT
jgi:hypothetical protein